MSRLMSVYCKAYQLKQLRAFPGWSESAGSASGETEPSPARDGESVVFVHDDCSVTEGVFRDEKILFASSDRDWLNFCEQQLQFAVPEDVMRAREFSSSINQAGAP